MNISSFLVLVTSLEKIEEVVIRISQFSASAIIKNKNSFSLNEKVSKRKTLLSERSSLQDIQNA